MAKRTRKPPIQLEKRREWLRRYEEIGESMLQIAKHDSFDIRTVRKQIQLAQQERESREARLVVLRSAVEHHYADLLHYMESLDPQTGPMASGYAPQDSEFLESALRQHLPRSPVWGYLTKLRQLREEMISQRQVVKTVSETMAGAESRLDPMVKTGLTEVRENVARALAFQSEQWSLHSLALHVNEDFRSESAGEGKVKISYGAFVIGIVDESRASELIAMLRGILPDLESRLRQSEEHLAVEKTIAEIARVERKLREELAIIRLRRIVPGRCKYCPL